MKEIEKEKLANKTMIRILAMLAVVLGVYLVDRGYIRLGILQYMPSIMLFMGITFIILTVAFTWIAYNKKAGGIYNYATYFGFLAVITMLIKINYEMYALEFPLNIFNQKFIVKLPALIDLFVAIYIPVSLIYVIYRITKKNNVQRV